MAQFVFAASPIIETSASSTSQGQLLNPLLTLPGGVEVNDGNSWFTFFNSDIGNGTIDSNTPYAIVRGTGSGTQDRYTLNID